METQTATRTYTIDPSHSQVSFKVRHLGFSKVRGRFTGFEGTVRMTPGDFSTLEADASVELETITTGDQKRDAHLRSDDFFSVEQHPTMTFEGHAVSGISDDGFKLEGDLTIRGTTKPVVLDVTYLGEATDPWGGTRVAFEARGKINRKDFGLNWNQALETGGFLVGDEVEIELEVQAVQQ